MKRPSRRNLHHRLRGFEAAKLLVAHMAMLWSQEGQSLRLTRKILRKHGIHAWSLLDFLFWEDRVRMARSLNLPQWAVAAFMDPSREPLEWEIAFDGLPRGARLPEGLLLVHLNLRNSPHLRKLPHRLRPGSLFISDCAALEGIAGLAARPNILEMKRCPRLNHMDPRSGPTEILRVEACPSLCQLPHLPAHQPHRWNQVMLIDLPQLRGVSHSGVVGELYVNKCPHLTGLSGFTVKSILQLHRCQRLRSLPRFQGTVGGHITDCQSLGEIDLAGIRPSRGSTLKLEPLRGACCLPPLQRIPALQLVEVKPLFAPFEFAENTAWPWPPRHRVPGNVEVERTLKALGLSPLQRLHCEMKQGDTLAEAIGCALSRSKTPGHALQILREYLNEALAEGNAGVIQALLDQAGAFGIGPLSLWLVLPHKQQQALLPRLPAWWRVRLPETSTLEEVSDALHGIPGPLILAGRINTADQSLGPRWIEGPLWVEGDLSLDDCTELEALPELMVVTGDLQITRCPALRCFPKRLEVGGNLWVEELPRLARSVCRTQVGRTTTVTGVPALKLVPPGSWES